MMLSGLGNIAGPTLGNAGLERGLVASHYF